MKNQRSKRSVPEINTTALPDIIFMLLFFFMVVTVIKKEEPDNIVQLPITTQAELMKMEKETTINIAVVEDDGNTIINIDGDSYLVGPDYKLLVNHIEKGIQRKSASVDKAIVGIDKNLSMEKVNLIKSALQENEIYALECLALVN